MNNYEELMDYIAQVEGEDLLEIGKYILEHYDPQSIIDIGCGPGFYSKPAADAGRRVLGLDSCSNAGAQLPEGSFKRVSIADFKPEEHYDLAICIEVAEHLPEQLSDTLVTLLCDSSNTVLFSAAPPGQGGFEHINCQHMKYWLSKFDAKSFEVDWDKTSELWNFLSTPRFNKVYWLRTNTRVLRRVLRYE